MIARVPVGHFHLVEKITGKVQRESVVADIAGNHGMASIAQHSHDRTTSGRRLPQTMWELLNAQQRLHCTCWCLVQVVAALGVCVRHAQHG
jgi:hypothetical protein